MAEVYFSKEIEGILNQIDFSLLGKNVAIKVHFGEKGCNTYINPQIVKAVYDRVVSFGRNAALVECNVLYKGSRVNSTSHIKTAKEHGFLFAPIDILDGEKGNETIEVEIKNGLVKTAKLGKGLEKYDSMIVLTHFKGHMAAGFGGALKNIGMGLGSRAGKLAMHSSIKPSINVSKCTGCSTCIKNCDVKAICLENGKAKINPEICMGCAMCIGVCPHYAVNIPWAGSTQEELQKKIVDYSEAALKLIPNTIFINVLQNITEECDCMGIPQKSIIPDIGFLYSKDIVSIDKASLDLVNKKSDGKFDTINRVNKNLFIESAYEKGLGEKEYKLIEM